MRIAFLRHHVGLHQLQNFLKWSRSALQKASHWMEINMYGKSKGEHTFKALRYGTRSQGISQFYLHTPRSSANGINYTCLCLPSRSWYSFTNPKGIKFWVGLGGWLVAYRNKRPAPELNPDTVAHLSTNQARRRLISLIEANVLTATPDHQYLSYYGSNRVAMMKRTLFANDDEEYSRRWRRQRTWR